MMESSSSLEHWEVPEGKDCAMPTLSSNAFISFRITPLLDKYLVQP